MFHDEYSTIFVEIYIFYISASQIHYKYKLLVKLNSIISSQGQELMPEAYTYIINTYSTLF